MVPASSVAHWDYLTGNVLAASDAFLNDHPDLVEKLVARFEQTRYDYRSKEEGSYPLGRRRRLQPEGDGLRVADDGPGRGGRLRPPREVRVPVRGRAAPDMISAR